MLTLVLLASMGAPLLPLPLAPVETCVLNVPLNASLFRDALSVGSTIRIVQGNWAEARLVPHVAGLILKEIFGQTVEYVLADTAWSMYDMLHYDTLASNFTAEDVASYLTAEDLASNGSNASKQADLALTLWPANYWGANRSAALNAKCAKSSTERCVSIVGNTGYRARSGWFITANTTNVQEDLVGWSTITSLLSPAGDEPTSKFTKSLTKAHELEVTDLCEKYEKLSAEPYRYDGFFNWLLIDSNPNPHPSPHQVVPVTLTPTSLVPVRPQP